MRFVPHQDERCGLRINPFQRLSHGFDTGTYQVIHRLP
jgi:hypothetical protein